MTAAEVGVVRLVGDQEVENGLDERDAAGPAREAAYNLPGKTVRMRTTALVASSRCADSPRVGAQPADRGGTTRRSRRGDRVQRSCGSRGIAITGAAGVADRAHAHDPRRPRFREPAAGHKIA
jgi:hypothetical protein